MAEKKNGWVSKKDFCDFKEENNIGHQEINTKLDNLEPLIGLLPDLRESVVLRQNTELTVKRITSFAKTVAVFLGLASLIVGIILGLKGIFK